ncbi:hypothetical protein A2W24_03500 [Microgenomates group bacterium RBG_16_45_19]|nr:MAG: hypothetical protein A2W24_03500 [Microgenomates group bacterium RBG_16_45_19]
MYSFATYLKKNKQVGAVTGINNAYVMVEGIPEVKVNELVSFENRAIGLAAQLLPETVRVMHLSGPVPALGTQATLTRELMTVKVDSQVLGALLDGLGRVVQSGGGSEEQLPAASLPIDGRPLPLNRRRMVTQALETGVAIVDILVPLARGQRELVIGDRKTGKTEFVRQTMLSHMFNGGICVYGGIARRAADVNTLTTYFQSKGLLNHLVRVVSMATDTTAACYLAPYTAMAVAEYFRDLGREVVIVLDDMTLHAKYCRELALLARQPPDVTLILGIFFTRIRGLWNEPACLIKVPLLVCPLPIRSWVICRVISRPT